MLKNAQKGSVIIKGLDSQTGFFGPVICQKVKTQLIILTVIFMLFEYLCDSNIQKKMPDQIGTI